jgi:spermidine/putrescine-binding protein
MITFGKDYVMRKTICSILFIVLLVGVSYHDTHAEEIIFNWSGGSSGENVWKCYVDPFEAATGHKVIHDSAVNFSKLKAMVKTGNVSGIWRNYTEWTCTNWASRRAFLSRWTTMWSRKAVTILTALSCLTR